MHARVALVAVALICSACADAGESSPDANDDAAVSVPDVRGVDGAAEGTAPSGQTTPSARLEETLTHARAKLSFKPKKAGWAR